MMDLSPGSPTPALWACQTSLSTPLGRLYALHNAGSLLCTLFGRRVHADLAIPIQRHEAKRRIDRLVHHLQI